MIRVVGIKFKGGNKLYYFAPREGETYEKGAGVVVETAHGTEYAQVAIPPHEVEEERVVQPLKPIIRKATKEDEERVERNEARRGEAMALAAASIEKFNLPMKLIGCEFAFDGSKVLFYFTAENRVDFRELVKDLSSIFHMRIELRQVGIRDEIKIIGGLAPCGRECCCASCMPDCKRVTIKMAKTQGLSLNPGKISGLCGRLMCCLSYESEYYAEAYGKMPKVGSEVDTPEGKGTVVTINMLTMQVKVKIESRDSMVYRDFDVNQLKFKRRAKADDDDAGDSELKNIED